VLDASAAAGSLLEFLGMTLAALEEHLGHRQSAFMLALAEPPRPGRRAYAGVTHGAPEHVLEEYFERWADRDALASEAGRASYASTGQATIAELYARLEPQRRRFVDDFLRRGRQTNQLSQHLPAAWTEGYVTVMGPDEYDKRDADIMRNLAPRLTELLRSYLPRGLDRTLSTRESQVVELVALGFSNREIAGVLHVEEDTIKKHLSHALAKTGVKHRSALAVAWATGRRMDVHSRPPTEGVVRRND